MSVLKSAARPRILAASVLALATASLLATSVSAQQQQQQRPPARPAQPAQQQPAQQQPAQQGQAQQQSGPIVVQVKPEPSQAEWTKVCGKDEANNKEICYTTRDFISDQNQPVLAVAIYDIKPDNNRIARFLMPVGLLLQPGIRFGIDQQQPVPGRFTICFPNGCFAEAVITNDMINAFKRGGTLNVSVQNQVAREVTFAIPMTGFGKAFDGAPIDPAVLEAQQRRAQEEQAKLQEELQKRSDEMRKQLQSQGGAPAAAPAPKP